MSMLLHFKYIQNYKIFSKELIVSLPYTIVTIEESTKESSLECLNVLEVVLHILKDIQICIHISLRKNY